MPEVISPNKDLIDLIAQVLIIVIPVLITWFIRTYVKGTRVEKDLAAITRLSNTAIDYAENLDKQGAFDQLELSPDVSKGLHKLKVASAWMESELGRNGIKMSDEDASRWIQAEFQNRVGGIKMAATMAELAETAVRLIQTMERSGAITLSAEVDRIAVLTGLAADWLVTQFALQKGGTITREDALIWTRAALVDTLDAQPGAQATHQPTNIRLAELAHQAVDFMEKAGVSGQLKIKPGATGGDVGLNVATAWLLTEVARQGLEVDIDQVAEAVRAALQYRAQPGKL